MARKTLLVLTVLVAAVWSAPAPFASSAPTKSAPPQASYEEFKKAFDQALVIGAKKKLDDLMRRDQDNAVLLIVNTAEVISTNPNEKMFDRYVGARDAWNRVYMTNFPENMEVYFANLPNSLKAERRGIRAGYNKLIKQYTEAAGKADKAALNLVATEMEKLGEAFEKIGDKWYSSQCALMAGNSLGEQYHGSDADLHRVAVNYERMIAMREELGVEDTYFKQVRLTLTKLNGLGFGNNAKKAKRPGGGDDVDGEGGAPVGSAGSLTTVPMTFELFKDMKDTDRPSYYLDEHFQVWPSIPLKGTGSTEKFIRMESSPTIIREGSDKVMIDVDLDGKGDLQWPTRGKLEPVQFEIGSGAAKRPFAVFCLTGRQQDFYQGNQMNLMATDTAYALYHAPAGAMNGEIAGVPIQIVDDDFDGVYGSLPKAYQHFGLVPGTDHPDFDSIRIGGEQKAGPFSQFVNLGDAGWYKLEAKDGGTSIVAEPFSLPTGTVQLKGKGPKPDFFILQGSGDLMKDTYIDVSGGKKVEVPVGRWKLAWGLVRQGKKMQLVKASIVRTNKTPAYDVTEGENVVIEFGKPYKFDFQYAFGTDGIEVQGPTVAVLGAGGEGYDRFYGCVPSPEAGVRKKGSRRASAEAKMRPARSNDEIEKFGWGAMWKPMKVELAIKAEEVEVQLTEKKNKLFGKVESDWL